MNTFRTLAGSILQLLLVAVAATGNAAAADSQLHMVLACDDAHPELGEGFEVNEWAIRSALVDDVASSRLKLLNPDLYREGSAPPLTRKVLVEFVESLPAQADDAVIVYLACKSSHSAQGDELFRFAEDEEGFTRREILKVLQAKKVRLVGLISDCGSEYHTMPSDQSAISGLSPPITETSPLCEKLFFKSSGVLDVASASPGETARFYDNYTEIKAGEKLTRHSVQGERQGENVGDDHDLRSGYIRIGENRQKLKGGYFTESLVKTLQEKKDEQLTWEQLLLATNNELKDQLHGLKGATQTVQLLEIPGRTSPQPAEPKTLLGIEVEPAGDGVKITEVDPKGLAAEHGLEAGEILLTVNGKEVTNSEEVMAAFEISSPLKRVSGIDREGKPFSFVMKAKDRPKDAPGTDQPPKTNELHKKMLPKSDPKESPKQKQPPTDKPTETQPAGESNGPLRDPVEVGQEAAHRLLRQMQLLRHELGQQNDPRPLRVAVFPFVNSEGQVVTATMDTATAIAGELSRELSRSKDPAMDVVSPIELAKLPPQLLAGRAIPGEAEAQAILKALKCDFLVTGQFEATSAGELIKARQPEVTVQLSLHIPHVEAAFKIALQAETRSIQTTEGDPIGPFPLELISKGKAIALKPETREDLGTVYVAQIPKALEGQPFSIRLTSDGKTVGYYNRDPEKDNSRLMGVSLFVNGVCSLGQQLADGQFELGWGHWSQTPHHPLAAPGDPKAAPAQQPPKAPSVLEVDSYATQLESAPFIFATPSSGEGLITVHLFAEKLPGDRRVPRPGEVVTQTHHRPVKLVPWDDHIMLHSPPVLTHRIVYRVK